MQRHAQVATPCMPSGLLAGDGPTEHDGCVFIFDMVCPAPGCLSLLQAVLGSQHCIKVLHDHRKGLVVLQQHGMELPVSQVVDTQLLFKQLQATRVGKRFRIGLNDALAHYNLQSNESKRQMDHSLWALRPLSPEQLHYAAADCRLLLLLCAHIEAELSKGLPLSVHEYMHVERIDASAV